MGTFGDIVPNSLERYFPITLCHYCSYIVTEIVPLNLIHTVKYQSFSGKSH